MSNQQYVQPQDQHPEQHYEQKYVLITPSMSNQQYIQPQDQHPEQHYEQNSVLTTPIMSDQQYIQPYHQYIPKTLVTPQQNHQYVQPTPKQYQQPPDENVNLQQQDKQQSQVCLLKRLTFNCKCKSFNLQGQVNDSLYLTTMNGVSVKKCQSAAVKRGLPFTHEPAKSNQKKRKLTCVDFHLSFPINTPIVSPAVTPVASPTPSSSVTMSSGSPKKTEKEFKTAISVTFKNKDVVCIVISKAHCDYDDVTRVWKTKVDIKYLMNF
ncbi:unnamed protein product [Mytilus edulis]|uniref:Uncharacterized protein n=1 Tax=Mytilus edulis TaxID=6550 RepID=A0A8S3RS54_MYTED|nr:unnamed protein product [Mytilus edulis]